jgi:hypothetical protein
MNSSPRSSTWTWPALTAVLALGGCAGDPLVEFDDIPSEVSRAGSSAEGGDTASAGKGSTSTGSTTSRAGSESGGSSSSGGSGSSGSDTGGSTTMEMAGAGGDDPVAGSAGAGGEPPVKQTNPFDLIDDIEGAFPVLPQRSGRNGGWFTVHDESGGQTTAPGAVALDPPRIDSKFAARITGSGFTGWGAQLGVSLKSPATGYDASNYCGLRFLAKGSSNGWSMLVSDRASIPDGGTCVPGSSDPALRCYHYVGKNFAPAVDWQEYKIRFDELRYLDVADSGRRLDPSVLYDILFNVFDGSGSAFELQIDDLSFMDKTSVDCQ